MWRYARYTGDDTFDLVLRISENNLFNKLIYTEYKKLIKNIFGIVPNNIILKLISQTYQNVTIPK